MSWRQPRAFALRLHASAAPPRGGLTQALATYESALQIRPNARIRRLFMRNTYQTRCGELYFACVTRPRRFASAHDFPAQQLPYSK